MAESTKVYDRILLDMSNVYHKAYSVMGKEGYEVDGETIPTGAIYTCIKMIGRYRNTYLADVEKARMVYLFDNATSGESRRQDIDPEYKIDRAAKPPHFYRGLEYLQTVLMNMHDNDRVMYLPDYEADDLVSPLVNSYGDKHRTLLVSNDMDWLRALSATVDSLFTSSKGDFIYNLKSFEEEYGFSPTNEKVCFYKAIRGDASDNIPKGISGIPEKVLISILNIAGSIPSFYDSIGSMRENESLSATWLQAFIDNKPRILLNYRLVSYKPFKQEQSKEAVHRCKFNATVLRQLYLALHFNVEKLDPRLIVMEAPPREEDFFSSFDTIERA